MTATMTMIVALELIKTKQPEVLERLRRDGVVFDEKPHRDPANWQQIAFWIYTDLCEIDTIARTALASLEDDES